MPGEVMASEGDVGTAMYIIKEGAAKKAIMYLTCSEVADFVGFVDVDCCEVCYMLLYIFPCVFNVGLHICFALEFHVFHGQ